MVESLDVAVAAEDLRGGAVCNAFECADNGRLAPERKDAGSFSRHCVFRTARDTARVTPWRERIATSCEKGKRPTSSCNCELYKVGHIIFRDYGATSGEDYCLPEAALKAWRHLIFPSLARALLFPAVSIFLCFSSTSGPLDLYTTLGIINPSDEVDGYLRVSLMYVNLMTSMISTYAKNADNAPTWIKNL